MAQPFFGGIHPNDKKAATNKKPIEKLPPPARVVIPMSMHIGAPCSPCVAVGDMVTVGQRVGEPAAFVSAPVHASVSGKVVAVEPRIHFSGVPVMSVVIENDFNDTPCPDLRPVEENRGNGPAHYYASAGLIGRIGMIDAVSHKFCAGCNRVRLTSTGVLKPCLCYGEGADLRAVLRGSAPGELKQVLAAAIWNKPQAHCFDSGASITEHKNMSEIGG